jgi:predicted RecB family nuclease
LPILSKVAAGSVLGTLCALGDYSLYHYGSYESRFIAKMEKLYGIPAPLKEAICANSINVLSRLYAHVYLPTYSNDLKSVATFLGYRWSTEGATGIQSIVWRHRWEATRRDDLKRVQLALLQAKIPGILGKQAECHGSMARSIGDLGD